MKKPKRRRCYICGKFPKKPVIVDTETWPVYACQHHPGVDAPFRCRMCGRIVTVDCITDGQICYNCCDIMYLSPQEIAEIKDDEELHRRREGD